MPEDWKRRYTAPRIAQMRWAAEAPHRLAVVSNEDGSEEAWAWDLSASERRRVSDRGVGAEEAHILPDGSGVAWWLDELGDEHGRWMVSPFEGGEPWSLFPGMSDAWMCGISFSGGLAAAGFSTEDGYEIRVGAPGGPSRVVYSSSEPAGVGAEWPQGAGGLSADGTLIAIWHCELSDISHPAVRVLDVETGESVGDLLDEGRSVSPAGWSPVGGDRRLVVQRETGEFSKPWVWDLETGRLEELGANLPCAVTHANWYPGGTAVLVQHDDGQRHSLHRVDLSTGATAELVGAEGTIEQPGIRPDGDIWYRFASSVVSPTIRNAGGEVVLTLPDPPPAGRPFEPISFENPLGQTIHGFVVTPIGERPFPTVMSVHGGPEYHHTDDFAPEAQAFVDNGFAVVVVNYRGSTGYGREHREAIQANIGFPESEDVIAALDHVVATGFTDPSRVFLSGWSWGGYLATLNAGINPDRWRAVFAGIPAGDYVAAHYECAPNLRAWDLAVMGGSPEDLPELYHERNPMTYVDAVTAPMIVIAGEHDSRCPLGQVMTYVVRLRATGREVELHLYPEGHHTNVASEQARHIGLVIDFFRRHDVD